jgi:RimJ/RimL family protein N-acetyltransferase
MTFVSAPLDAIPVPLETGRLILRPLAPGDGPLINEAVLASFDQLARFIPWAKERPSVAESETFAREAAAQFRVRERLGLLIVRKADGLLIGGSGLHNIDWAVPSFEVGYWLRTSAEGHGYMTEAVQAQIAWAFGPLRAERVMLRCDVRNTRSMAVAQRAGFTHEGTLRRFARDNFGDLIDMHFYSIVRAEWLAGQPAPTRPG